jgi:o-succinylbenzoate synthase
MRVVGAEFAQFSLPLRGPLITGRGAVSQRVGFVLRLHGEDGVVGLGEASPAFWLGEERLEETERSLREIVRHERFDCMPKSEVSRAAVCAVETALLDLDARTSGVSAAVRLGGAAPQPIRRSALLVEPGLQGLAREVERVLEEGVRSLKLKVGGSSRRDLRRLEQVRRHAGPTVAIVLDANRSWSFDEARAALDGFAAFAPAWVEEPLRADDLGELARLRRATGVPIAVDESIRDVEGLDRVAAACAADVAVLKLARLGGPRSVMAIAARARAAGLRVALTDSIETAIGRSAVAHVACVLSIAEVGLGGARLLAEDVDGFGLTSAVFTPSGPGLGVTLDPRFERSLRWHA